MPSVQELVIKYKHTCGKFHVVLRKKGGSGVQLVAASLKCNSWLCPRCRKRKSRKFARAARAYFAGEKLSFLTITDDPRLTPSESFSTFAARWNYFRTSLTRKIGTFKYVRVLEEQPGTGRAHYHIIINRYIPGRHITELLSLSGFGRIYKIKYIQNAQVFDYVIKYLRKPWTSEKAMQLVIDNGLRLVSGSKGFRLLHPDGEKWELLLKLVSYDKAQKFIHTHVYTYTQKYLTLVSHNLGDESELFDFSFNTHFDDNNFDYFLHHVDMAIIDAVRHGVLLIDSKTFSGYINELVPQPSAVTI